MGITKTFSASRGTSNFISRIGTIISRFGITSGKFAALLDRYSTLTMQAGCTATLPITAVILRRHPDLIHRFHQKGLEFAIHGYSHIDYRQLSVKEQIEDYRKAIEVFNSCHVAFTGFRAPYLRYNNDTLYALNSLQFPFDSSHSLYWNVMGKSRCAGNNWQEYSNELGYYHSKNALEYLSLPVYSADRPYLVEIPVSLPDDESLVERLSITDDAGITRAWNAILEESHNRGELFTLQLHPERIGICGTAMSTVVRQARDLRPSVWITTLKEIAAWWKEKDCFQLDIQPGTAGRYHVKAVSSDRATLLVKNCRVSCETAEWARNYRSLRASEFTLESAGPPVIGIGFNVSPRAVRFLQSEGYPVEASNQADKYGIYLNNLSDFSEADKKPLIETIERSGSPLIRFWRWPNGSKSALTITGDIDSITLWDFGLRLLEARQQARRQKYHGEIANAGATV
jgi:peptidoglycan/xylan/chitin deacetylase (PgdA/CDA1 family)